MRPTALIVATGLACAPLPAGLHAQGRVTPPPTTADDTVRAAPGPRYAAGGFERFLAGSNWRDLWTTPLSLPVLDIRTFAGGLEPEREGGNKQSTTLHFVDASGTGWVFRSVDKYPSEKLSPAVEGTVVGDLIQDQISALHPAGALMLPPLLEAVGILHVAPVLYVMGDDPALGQFRETFAGMIGALELKPNEGPDDTPGFAGSRKIKDSEEFFEDLEDSPAHRLDERELVRVRLLDFIVGDTDRTTDQYRWVRFPRGDDEDAYIWRPLPRDRDWAFMRPNGLLTAVARATAFPKFVPFGRRHSDITAHTFSSHVVDRRLLAGLDRAAFGQEAAAVQRLLTDEVLEAAVRRLPPPYPESHAREVLDALRARRDAVAGIADAFYLWLATEVDVHATDEEERAELVRHADGRLELTIAPRAAVTASNGRTASVDGDGGAAAARPHYHRVFLPHETSEVRVFLHGGNDVGVVRGSNEGITVRLLGGGDDDVLADSSGAGGVHLYDDRGDNRFVRAAGTRVDTRSWDPPHPPEGLRVGLAWAPDWAGSTTWTGTADYEEAGGIILGAGRQWTDYGFRRLPYHWQVQAIVLGATAASDFGVELSGDYRFENARNSVEAGVRWSGYDGFRWFGPGNDTEELASDRTLVRIDRFSFEPALVWRFGPTAELAADTAAADSAAAEADSAAAAEPKPALEPLRASLAVGPVLHYTATTGAPASPFVRLQPIGVESMWRAGAQARLQVERTDGLVSPRLGLRGRAALTAYPGVLEAPGAAAHANAQVDAYAPLVGDALRLAVRAGAMTALGDYAAFDAAMIGGKHTLRGFRFQRFAGDAAAYGGAELRAPLGEIELLTRGEIGVFALLDAGRVWVDGQSPGGWHTGWGGGVSFESLGRAVSVALASGESERAYIWLGFPF